MKLKLLSLSLVAVLFSSCAAFRNVADQQLYIAPLVSVAANLVLNKAISPEDREAKAAEILKVAAYLDSVPITKKLTEEEFRKLLADVLPAKAHWAVLTDTVTKWYVKATKNLTDGDVTDIVAVFGQVSSGLEAAAKNYSK